MAKKPENKPKEAAAKKLVPAPSARRPVITVVEGDKTPHDELMKLPKAQILRNMSAPPNTARFVLDVDNQGTLGKKIIALMDSLGTGDPGAIKTVSEILGALANIVSKKAGPKK